MLFASPFITVYSLIIAAVAGMCAGSFLLCVAGRSTNGEGLRSLFGRSHCDACGHSLGAAELIPIFSYVFLRGRCRHCKAKLSPVYPASEAALAVIFMLLLMRYDISIEFVQFALLASALFMASAADIGAYIIPNGAVLFMIAVRLCFILTSGDILLRLRDAAIGAFCISLPVFVVSLVMEKILSREAMGGGDIKLFFAVGMYFGWRENILLLIIACVLGIVFGIVSALLSDDSVDSADNADNDGNDMSDKNEDSKENKDSKDSKDNADDENDIDKKMIPFGPSIAAAAVITSLVGSTVTGWYMSLF